MINQRLFEASDAGEIEKYNVLSMVIIYTFVKIKNLEVV